MNRRGTTQWTMSKLMTLVLAVILLALIIYGVQSKGFGPLKDNIEARFDEALLFFGVGNEQGEFSCGDAFVQEIDGVGSGNFYPCEVNCTFVPDQKIGNYEGFALSKKGFLVSYGSSWSSGEKYLSFEDFSYERDFYEESMTFVLEEFGESWENRDKLGVFEGFKLCDYFCPKYKAMMLKGENSNSEIEAELIYDGQIFIVKKGSETIYSGKDVNEALDLFYSLSRRLLGRDLDVSYNFDYSGFERLSELSSINRVFDDDDLDSDAKINALKKIFIDRINQNSAVSQEKVDILVEKFNNKEISFNEKEHVVSIDFSNKLFPYVVFDSSSQKIAIGYMTRLQSDSVMRVDHIPLGVYKYNSGVWEILSGSNFYKLSSEDFNEFVKINKIYKYFNLRRCGQ